MLAQVYLRKNEEHRIKHGHLWVFSNEVAKLEGEAQNGDVVELYDYKNNFLGTGFYNKNSLIALRLLSRGKIEDLHGFFKERLLRAYDLRKSLYPRRESFRLMFSESDFMPGLIIDKYNNTFVMQVYSFGMQKNIDKIVSVLKTELKAENVFSKNEAYFRRLEGLTEEDTVYLGSSRSEVISDGEVSYRIDFEGGHKTGFYFDQADNRKFIERITEGRTVIDAFCNSGGFGLHASRAGAGAVTFLDSSQAEVENARGNFQLNNITCKADFITGDVFDVFTAMLNEKKKFDVVMIDPPAFAKNKKSLPMAQKGYEKLNRMALGLVEEGGFLVTSSCSYHLSRDSFIQIINSAAQKAGRQVQLIHFNGASLDHPRLPAMEETSYLKFAVLKVI
ncbi:MAG: class I SAM-dependent rRNA methyltransferase [Bacteroidota bacterium]|jgi:23S rRNA (cytosine1962-C5)-methyltransferase|nr:class I SAM-dependent rRNA methyltransferase [Ignavibacteria bacterium]HEX2962110.1 class I SAM-dependent rRNA methyltransferase [Ignavibacteriales bacterium]MCU7499467.1 class I SAM-dependent rRNA methyltransferase [Ignavibacteria bacterium]MCU7512702.1 class I SAM-dependent rRNA methyltransferase [Ignavibacteria bacterium]MCU7521869.1 class I SAM-dependent rRNA methyltransferase [Ignavibacteria bacterium]